MDTQRWQNARRSNRQTRIDLAQSRPAFELSDTTMPYIPTVDSAAASFEQQRLIVRDVDGRRVAI